MLIASSLGLKKPRNPIVLFKPVYKKTLTIKERVNDRTINNDFGDSNSSTTVSALNLQIPEGGWAVRVGVPWV